MARRLTSDGLRGAFAMPTSFHDPCIQRRIAQQGERAERNLGCTRESGRVDRRGQVVRNESAGVSLLPRACAQGILERGEWAHAAGELHEDSPRGHRHVCPGHSWPAHDQQRSQQYERKEREVKEENEDG